MITFAMLTGPLPRLGVIAVALLAAAAILSREAVPRAWAMLGALALAPILLLADIWHSPQLGLVHHHPLEVAIGAALVLAALAAVARAIAIRPWLVGPLAAIALPFRIPISTSGASASKLLVPLYFVIAAAALAWLVPVLAGQSTRRSGGVEAAPSSPAVRGFEQLLAGYVILYAIQATYSADFEQALENTVFFYLPFALLFGLMRDLAWDRRLMIRTLGPTVLLAIGFACIAFVEEATKSVFLNTKLIETNSSHPYFTVNSVFYDPDIFGRYLAIVMILLVAVLLYERRRNAQLAVAAVLAVLWGGLVLTLSRSSLAALLLGMATLAALRWKARPVVIAAALVIVLSGAALAITPRTFGLNQGLNNASSGRANLVTGGVRMFADRPLWGYGPGGFVTEYKRRYPHQAAGVSASHTIPVTVAAEQGVIGLLVYLALVLAALRTLFDGARGRPGRAAIAAAFLALLAHTMLYAAFLEDPLTWTLLAIGSALAAEHATERYAATRESRRRRRMPAVA